MKTPACAVCKHQRRRCDEDCFMAPFFPAEKTKDFEAVHKLFGLHNIVNHLQKLTPEQRSETIISMVYEANARVRDPVTGCSGILSTLMQRFNTLKAHLNFVQNQIAYHRALKQQQVGEQNMVHNAGSVDLIQEINNANLLQSLDRDFNFLHENLENPQQLQESSFAKNQFAHYHTLKQQQLGEQNMVHNAGSMDFLQENDNANRLQSLDQDFNFLHENLENPQQLQESSFAQEIQLCGGDRQAGNPDLTIDQPVQRPLQNHQATGFVQGSYQSTNLSTEASKNMFGGEDVEPERGKPSSSSSKVHGRKRRLEDREDYLDDIEELFRA